MIALRLILDPEGFFRLALSVFQARSDPLISSAEQGDD